MFNSKFVFFSYFFVTCIPKLTNDFFPFFFFFPRMNSFTWISAANRLLLFTDACTMDMIAHVWTIRVTLCFRVNWQYWEVFVFSLHIFLFLEFKSFNSWVKMTIKWWTCSGDRNVSRPAGRWVATLSSGWMRLA